MAAVLAKTSAWITLCIFFLTVKQRHEQFLHCAPAEYRNTVLHNLFLQLSIWQGKDYLHSLLTYSTRPSFFKP